MSPSIIVIFLVVTALLVFSYHYERNGNPWHLGGFLSRAIWGMSTSLAYFAWHGLESNMIALVLLIPLSYLTLLVPHAWAQCMGSWPKAQRRWPGFFLKTYTDDQWTALSPLRRTLYDFTGMASVGFIRGAICFAPLAFAGLNVFAVIFAALAQALAQPLSYLLGYHFPLQLFGNAPRSPEWGEFGVGVGWSFSFLVLVLFGG